MTDLSDRARRFMRGMVGWGQQEAEAHQLLKELVEENERAYLALTRIRHIALGAGGGYKRGPMWEVLSSARAALGTKENK